MVQIVGTAADPGDRSFTVNCPGCRTRFKFKAKEAVPYGDRDGPGLKLPCPRCTHLVWMRLK